MSTNANNPCTCTSCMPYNTTSGTYITNVITTYIPPTYNYPYSTTVGQTYYANGWWLYFQPIFTNWTISNGSGTVWPNDPYYPSPSYYDDLPLEVIPDPPSTTVSTPCEHCQGSGVGFDMKTYMEIPNGCTRCGGSGIIEQESTSDIEVNLYNTSINEEVMVDNVMLEKTIYGNYCQENDDNRYNVTAGAYNLKQELEAFSMLEDHEIIGMAYIAEQRKQSKCEHCNGSGIGLDWATLKDVPGGCTRCDGKGVRVRL